MCSDCTSSTRHCSVVKGCAATANASERIEGVWHRDSHYRMNLIGGGTQDTDFNKGKVGRRVTIFSWMCSRI